MSSNKTETQSSISSSEAEQNIQIAALSLGLSFLDAVNLFKYDPKAKTAYWMIDRKTGQESIHIGPAIAKLPPNLITIVLRHELLHRSLFHGFFEQFENEELANLVLDICINRLLYDGYSFELREVCERLYPENSKRTIVALADVSANPHLLPLKLADLWHYIWDEEKSSESNPLNPASLYFKLLSLGNFNLIKIYTPFALLKKSMPKNIPAPALQKAIDKVVKDINKNLSQQPGLAEKLSEYSISTIDIGVSHLETFIKRIRVKRIADKIANKILEPYQKKINVQPYLKYPSRMGIIYQIYGISKLFKLYWNIDVQNIGVRLAISVYVDVSGSMVDFFDIVFAVVEKIKEIPLVIKLFDTSLRKIEISDLKKKKIIGGGGTDFNLPIEDLTNNEQIDAGVIFTDGYGDVNPEVGSAFLKSKKRLYVVYFNSDESYSDSLEQYASASYHF